MKKETLLQKAKKILTRRNRSFPSDEQIELGIAWLSGEVTSKQVAGALGKKNFTGSMMYLLATWIKAAYQQKKIKIKKG